MEYGIISAIGRIVDGFAIRLSNGKEIPVTSFKDAWRKVSDLSTVYGYDSLKAVKELTVGWQRARIANPHWGL